jgi:hypothetical protein
MDHFIYPQTVDERGQRTAGKVVIRELKPDYPPF